MLNEFKNRVRFLKFKIVGKSRRNEIKVSHPCVPSTIYLFLHIYKNTHNTLIVEFYREPDLEPANLCSLPSSDKLHNSFLPQILLSIK